MLCLRALLWYNRLQHASKGMLLLLLPLLLLILLKQKKLLALGVDRLLLVTGELAEKTLSTLVRSEQTRQKPMSPTGRHLKPGCQPLIQHSLDQPDVAASESQTVHLQPVFHHCHLHMPSLKGPMRHKAWLGRHCNLQAHSLASSSRSLETSKHRYQRPSSLPPRSLQI